MPNVSAPPSRTSVATSRTNAASSQAIASGNALVRRGQSGPTVAQLQETLNAQGANPPLETDGVFGAKTEAALKAFQSQRGLKADGILGPLSLSALGRPQDSNSIFVPGTGAQLTAPTVEDLQKKPPGTIQAGTLQGAVRPPINVSPPSRPTGPVASQIVANAMADEGRVQPGGANYKGWKYLQSVFEKTTGWKPQDAVISKDSTPNGKNWCGIWATHMLQQSGVDAKWDLSKGRMTGDVDMFTSYGKKFAGDRKGFEGDIRPGDVILLNGKLNHHAVVTSVNQDGTVNTMDGNHPGIGKGKHKLKDVYAFYRAKGAESAPVSTTPSASTSMPAKGLSNASAPPKAPAPVPTPAGAVNNEGGGAAARPAGTSIDSQFYQEGVTGSALKASEATMREQVNLLGSKSARMNAMQNFTQFDTQVSDAADNNACGATNIVVGATLEGGQKGLQSLMRVIEDRGNETLRKGVTTGYKSVEIPEWSKLSGIKERIDSGSVTKQDLSDLKSIVYQQLRVVEKDVGANYKNETVNLDAIKEYIQTDTAYFGTERPLAGMFQKMNMKLVDTTGDGVGNHYVLFFNRGNGTREDSLYDPWPTKSGKQINTNVDDQLWYHHGVKNALR